MRKLKLDELNRLSVEEFAQYNKQEIIVLLDNIRSAHNVGSIFRTCDGLAIKELHLCGITARPPHKEITKTAIGATQSVDWIYEADIKVSIENLKANGYTIVGVEQTDDSVLLQELDKNIFRSKIALILGNEVEGIQDEIINLLDYCIEVPQFGTKHSFNVSVCAGMVLWELTKINKL